MLLVRYHRKKSGADKGAPVDLFPRRKLISFNRLPKTLMLNDFNFEQPMSVLAIA